MASVKRPRSTSQEHLPAEGITPFAANSIQTDLKAQISTSQGFKSPRTKTQTSPTARTVQAHPYNNSHIPQQSPAELDISMSAFTAGPSSSSNPNHINASAPFVSSVQPPSSLHNGFDSTSVLSSGLSSPAASPPSPDHSPLDLGAGAARVMGFGEFFNPQPQQIVSSKNNTTSGATGPPLPHQPAWSTYTSPSPHAYAHAQFGPPSGGSGSSYRGSMDDSLGLGAGYGLPNSALAGLGLESNSPLGFAAVSDASMPPPAPPSISLSSVGQPQNIAAPAGPPPAHPPPEPPTVSAPTASLAQLPQPVSPATPSSAQHQSWNSFSPLAMGFRETRKGQDLGLGLEDFEVIETLGTGTFGRVFLCRLLRSSIQNVPQFFAMKVLSKVEVVRLKQIQHINSERTILSAVRQNGIVNLFCTFQDEKNLYLLMEFIQGGELFSHLRRAGRFSADVARFYAANIILTLDYLHSKDIIYRDLKPENLLLDHQGYIKVTDFGFAKCVPDRTFTLCGTPEYLAPEIIQSTGHGKAADYWALGVLLFEMMCGYPCFWADNPLGIYEKILTGRVYFPDHVDPVARDLIRRLLSSNLSKRLGNLKGGVKDIMEHPWFEGVDWDMVRRREIMAPIVPRARSAGDCSHFEKYGAFSLENLPALARAAEKRTRIKMGMWREPSDAEKDASRLRQAAEDHFADYFTDF